MTNTKALKSEMVKAGTSQKDLAKILGVSEPTLNYKINNKREFKASEIDKIARALEITNIGEVFFAKDVD